MKDAREDLLNHYAGMFRLFDCVHYNSSNTERIYRGILPDLEGQMLSITHGDIHDHRQRRSLDDGVLRLIFIGSTAEYKGFPLLLEVLEDLSASGYHSWALDVWGAKGVPSRENVRFHGRFAAQDLPQIFKEDALLIVPSVWDETFSLITLEALSFGVPVMLSSTVGAKDVIEAYDSWFVFASKEELKQKLVVLLTDRTRLRLLNEAICEGAWAHSLPTHAQEILKLYQG